jgi:spoIIIJ-associated protein
MLKVEATTIEEAYEKAASSLKCSATELQVEVAQSPRQGFLGLFKKSAIIVAICKKKHPEIEEDTFNQRSKKQVKIEIPENAKEEKETQSIKSKENEKQKSSLKKQSSKEIRKRKNKEKNILNDTIMPISFVSMQDDENEYDDVSSYLADYEDDFCEDSQGKGICEIVTQVQEEINLLFNFTCFNMQSIEVSVYNEETLLIEFKGDDSALLIGKEGYRYKALSYMIFNWLNAKYKVHLRLEIAEFLKNQEDSIEKYLVGICENIEKDGRAQTKILDGVLIQIALTELRDRYPNKYIAIRSTRDGLKYIIINDYHNK